MSGRLITLTVSEIQYRGDSVGDDPTLIVELGGGRLEVDKKLRPGGRSMINKEVGQIWSESGSLPLTGIVRVVERDLVYTESGETAIAWSLDARDEGLHETEYEVQAAEAGEDTRSASALFLVAIRANVVASTRCVSETQDGWLAVVSEDTHARASLPETVQVEVTRAADGREYFRVNEGAHRGRTASVRLNTDGASRVAKADPRKPAAKLIYSISRKELRLAWISTHPSLAKHRAALRPIRAMALGPGELNVPRAFAFAGSHVFPRVPTRPLSSLVR